MRALSAIFTGLGAFAGLHAALWVGMLAGWGLNIYKLFAHSPAEFSQWGLEQVIRLIGLIPLVGGIVGWF